MLAVLAHLDTVFPEGTDVKVRRDGDRLMAPGVGDDSRGLAFVLAMIRAMDAATFQTDSDLLFVGRRPQLRRVRPGVARRALTAL